MSVWYFLSPFSACILTCSSDRLTLTSCFVNACVYQWLSNFTWRYQAFCSRFDIAELSYMRLAVRTYRDLISIEIWKIRGQVFGFDVSYRPEHPVQHFLCFRKLLVYALKEPYSKVEV